LKYTEFALFEGLKEVRSGKKINDISKKIDDCARHYGLSPVKEFTGHGIGKELHEDPYIPNFNMPSNDLTILSGMTLAIEPILNFGTDESYVMEDG